MRIVICGLSITSSWGNGHATTYRGLVQGLCRRGHSVLFLERDKPWYAANRDMANSSFGHVELYGSLAELEQRFRLAIRSADFVIVGSFVPDGVAVAEWVLKHAHGPVAFYDIDTPVTLAKLESGDTEYLTRDLIPQFDLYLSFTGGPTLRKLEREYRARRALPLYCSVDPGVYYPEQAPRRWELGYLGTYSDDRQPALESLMLKAARGNQHHRFVVAGSLYPDDILWPANVERIDHLPPAAHRTFYNSQQFTLNITRRQMIQAGYSPSVRIFEAGACGVPIISDPWAGLNEILEPGKEVLIARGPQDTMDILRNIDDSEAREIGSRARKRILGEHTAEIRSIQLENYLAAVAGRELVLRHHSAHSFDRLSQ
jgi:spore maturation protein CgeB